MASHPDELDWRDGVRVAYLHEPPFFIAADDGGLPSGCDIELLAHVLDALGVRRVAYVRTEFPDLIPGLVAGAWTINVPMFATPERAALVDFSRPVWAAVDGLVVRAADAERLVGYAAIAADREAVLAVVDGQVQEQTALRAGVPADRIRRYPDQRATVAAVRAGEAAASASTSPGCRWLLAGLADPRLALVADAGGTAGRPPVGAFSFARRTPDLRRAVDAALGRYLGSRDHLALMARYGFAAADLRPVLDA